MNPGVRYLLISASLFQIVNVSVKALSHLPVEQIVFWRAFISVTITFAFLKAWAIPVWGNDRRRLVQRALAGTVALSLFFYTLKVMPLASAVTIQYLAPIFTVIFSSLFFQEKVTRLHWLCAVLGFLGVWMIQGFDARVSGWDALCGVVSAMASAVAYNTVRSLRHSDHEWVVIFYFPLIASALSAPFAIRSWVSPRGWDWALILVAGVFTQAAQLYLTKAYRAEQASRIAPVGYVGVVWAILFGVVFFDERLPFTTVAGILVILGSVLVSANGQANKKPLPGREAV